MNDQQNPIEVQPLSPIPVSQSVHKKIYTRWWFILLVLIVCAGLVFMYPRTPILYRLFSHDLPPVNDSDLLLTAVQIPDAQNGFLDLSDMNKSIYYPTAQSQHINDIQSGKTWDQTFVDYFLSKNSVALQHFQDASIKQYIQNPAIEDPKNLNPTTLLVYLNGYRNMAIVASVNALNLAKKGKYNSAFDQIFTVLSVGQKVENSPVHGLLEYLIGISMKGIALRTFQSITGSSTIRVGDATKYINELSQFMGTNDGLVATYKAEYMIQKWMYDRQHFIQIMLATEDDSTTIGGITVKTAKKLAQSSYYYMPNKTISYFADEARSEIENADAPCADSYNQETSSKLTPQSSVAQYFTSNLIGDVIHDEGLVSLKAAKLKLCEEQASVNMTELLLAIKSYKDAHKSYPASLNDLMPTYFDVLPKDPFSGTDFQYSAANKTIMSAHQNSTVKINF